MLDSSEKYNDPNAPEIYEKIRDDYHVFIEWKSFLDVKIKVRFFNSQTFIQYFDYVWISRQNEIKADHEETGRCDYEISKETFYTERAALAFGKDMQWIKKFDV